MLNLYLNVIKFIIDLGGKILLLYKMLEMKSKKRTRSKIIKLLDSEISKYVRMSNADSKWFITCISCWVRIPFKKAHCCHRISRWCLRYRFDLDNLAPWCAWCNTYRPEFHIREYTIKQIEKFWLDKVNEMRDLSKKVYKIRTPELEEMLEKYKELNKIQRERLGIK